MTADKDTPSNGQPSEPGEVLSVQDVLSGVTMEGAEAATLGASLVFETVGNDTVISVDIDGTGPAAPLPILTLTNVAGKTLQDILSVTVTDG